ncbi:MAG: hypothetical protein JNL74_06725 [Fibrobacteres bacterium]|nr:hypothetical protein [Fibrobacterota bacterium]
MKTKIILCIIIFSLSLSYSDSGILDSDYNLGRIIGNRATEHSINLYDLGGVTMLLNAFHSQAGVDSLYSFGYTGFYGGFFAEGDALFAGGLPEFDLKYRLSNSSSLFFTAMPINAFIGIAPSSEETFMAGIAGTIYLPVYGEFNFLSRDGSIVQESDQYDLSFLYGPLLNRNQFRLKLSVSKTFSSDEDLSSFEFYGKSSYGLLNNLQLGIDYKYHPYTYYPSSYDTSSSSKMESYSEIDGNINCRSSNLHLTGKISRISDSWRDYKRIESDLNITHLHGKRISEIDYLLGNWDNFHTEFLGEGQFLNSINIKGTPSGSYQGRVFSNTTGVLKDTVFDINKDLKITQTSKYAFLKYYTVGETFSFKAQERVYPQKNLSLSLAYSNVPLSSNSPSTVSEKEYLYGRILLKNQLIAKVNYNLPLFDESYNDYYFPIGYYTLSTDLYENDVVDENNFNSFSNLLSSDKYFTKTNELKNRSVKDFSIQAALGLADNASVGYSFSWSRNFIETYQYNYYGYYDPYYQIEKLTNDVFENHFRLSFVTERGNNVSLIFKHAIQTFLSTEPNFQSDEWKPESDFIINVLYQKLL